MGRGGGGDAHEKVASLGAARGGCRSEWMRVCDRRDWFRINSQSRHSERAERTQRSAKALALGDRMGVRMTRTSSEAKTASKEPGGLGVSVADQEAHRPLPVRHRKKQISSLLGHPEDVPIVVGTG